MKYSFFTLVAICLAMHVFAQQDVTLWTSVIQKNINHPQINIAAKTTGLTERLSAIAIYKPDVGPSNKLTDSAMYQYYGIRGSRFDFNAMRYNDSSNLTDLLFDTALYYKSVNGSMVTAARVGGTYTATNQLLNQLSQLPVGNFFQHIHSDSFFYNANHTLARQRHYTWMTNVVFDTVSECLYAYNTMAQVTQSVNFIYAGGFVFTPDSRNDYHYNAAGKQDTIANFVYTSSTWKNSSRIFFEYYPGDLLRKFTIQNFVGNAWVNSVKDSFGYGAFNIYNYYQEQTWNGSQWVNAISELRHANAQGVPDSQYVSYWNPATQAYYAPTVTSWTYDSLFRPTMSVKYDSAGNFVNTMKYYYETYNTTVSVPEVKTVSGIIYPNPVSNSLFIKWGASGVPDQVKIINAQGQMVKTSYTKDDTQTVIQVANLAPGIYWIKGVSKGGRENFHASFVKQ